MTDELASGRSDEPLLSVSELRKYFGGKASGFRRRTPEPVRAVDGVSFDIARGETLGLVGESGCGKSTIVRVLLGLEQPTGGTAHFDGRDLFALSRREVRSLRRDVQVVFQDPFAALSPRMRVQQIVEEPLTVHEPGLTDRARRNLAVEMIEKVGLHPSDAKRFPHEFSGGQRQRISIARALIVKPKLVLCDEPVSALDVSVQAQILTLLTDLQRDLNVAYLFIGHDLAVVRHVSHRIAVMYLGKIVEVGTESQIHDAPVHPYTQALLSAVPIPDPDGASQRRRIVLEGDVPSPKNPPSGCTFRTRCWKAVERCATEEPLLATRSDHAHPASCHFAEPMRILPSSATLPTETAQPAPSSRDQ